MLKEKRYRTVSKTTKVNDLVYTCQLKGCIEYRESTTEAVDRLPLEAPNMAAQFGVPNMYPR